MVVDATSCRALEAKLVRSQDQQALPPLSTPPTHVFYSVLPAQQPHSQAPPLCQPPKANQDRASTREQFPLPLTHTIICHYYFQISKPESLLREHKDLNSDPRGSCKKLVVTTCIRNPHSMKRQQPGGPLDSVRNPAVQKE